MSDAERTGQGTAEQGESSSTPEGIRGPDFSIGASFERLGELILLTAVTAFFAYMVVDSFNWPGRARLVPLVAIAMSLPFLLLRWSRVLRRPKPAKTGAEGSEQILDIGFRSSGDDQQDAQRFFQICVFILAMTLGFWLVGVEIAAPLGVLIYLYYYADAGLVKSVLLSALILGIIVVLYNRILNVPWPEPLLWTWLGGG